MPAAPPPPFVGFPAAAAVILGELAENNNTPWFAAHRVEYESLVADPARGLVVEVARALRRHVPELRAEPRPGGSILRPRRDARFNLRAPFRPHLEVWWWEGAGPSRDHPGFFFRLEPRRLLMGGGVRVLPPDQLARFRAAVCDSERGRVLQAILHRLRRAGWELRGRTLRRRPAGGEGEERADLLLHSGLWVETDALPQGTVHDPALVAELVAAFRRLLPLHRWLLELWP